MNPRSLFGTVACAILVLAISSTAVLGQDVPKDNDLPTGDSNVGCCLPCCCSRWTASADFILMDRIGRFNQTLVETVPKSQSPSDPGTEMLNANDLQPGFSGGPRLGLIRHGDSDYDLELSYFQIDGWSSYRSIGPTPDYWLVMKAPGDFLQTQDDKDKQMMAWNYVSRLYNAELNVRWNPCARITMLAGFRWINLSEELQGKLPPERSVPFWDTNVRNNLYGFQIGAAGKLFERGRFSIDGVAKAGIFDNDAKETTGVSIYRTVYQESASTNHAAFLGETVLQCKYQVTQKLLLKVGYEAMWLQGVALAPAQVQETLSHIQTPVGVQALGIDSGSGVFYHGATAGLEFSF